MPDHAIQGKVVLTAKELGARGISCLTRTTMAADHDAGHYAH